MTQEQVIRAWKDPDYRSTLSEAELAALPANPAGAVEVSPEQLDGVAGGTIMSLGCVSLFLCHADSGAKRPLN